jgi:isopenicillin N synthase-like dioxygenase
MGSMTEQAAIPTIDISAMLSPTASEQERQAVVESMSDACHTYGFFNLVGHGVPQESLKDALACNKLFFSQSDEKKMEVSIDKSVGRSFRGYEPPGIQTHHEGLLPDTKEVRTSLSQLARPR